MGVVRKAVITAAGRGTRLFPATRSIQKELLPLVDRDGLAKPTIQIIIEECLQSGIEDICIVVGKDGCEIGTLAGPAQWDSGDGLALIEAVKG